MDREHGELARGTRFLPWVLWRGGHDQPSRCYESNYQSWMGMVLLLLPDGMVHRSSPQPPLDIDILTIKYRLEQLL